MRLQEAAEEAAAPRRGVEVGTRVGLFAESLLLVIVGKDSTSLRVLKFYIFKGT